ncbi:MAG: T9SS type A sorting domain-containing protein [Bacteroidetes bacterium]|nr:T9SS type A sorting domain-containing protein [Bacteroidota bacterium]
MKTKILLNLFLVSTLGLIFVTMTSEENGIYNGGTTCGTCHGNKNTNTTVILDGLPANYQIGQTYLLSLKVINATKPKAGFNILASGGTFVAGTGSKINGAATQITHTTPMTVSGGIASFDFNWIAPTSSSTTSVTFSAVGNAVNGDGNDNTDGSDEWNNISQTIAIGFPSSAENIDIPEITCYPNPVNDKLLIKGLHHNFGNVVMYNAIGQIMPVSPKLENTNIVMDCSKLKAGTYYLIGSINGKKVSTSFIKN